ncbi:MAG: hypothetical protein FWD21_00035 [Peptococcaceae bacterium]|nr:hypothetical protein [Peptococcaceae bacterium]
MRITLWRAVKDVFINVFINYGNRGTKSCSILVYLDIICYMAKKKGKQLNLGQVIIPGNHPNPPLPHEVDTALALARHYQTTVEFLIPIDDYMRKTPDVALLGVEWELKCPTGASKSTIENQFRRGSRQSRNIIIDTRRTKLDYQTIENRVLFELKKHPSVKKAVLIDKFERVIEIQK